ncbi:MAG: hypothetical protein D3905_12370 [Candidatus Electrothrix sp. AS4_5]|nr:hypothetical protein [Candidatus Electrothrix gigas]
MKEKTKLESASGSWLTTLAATGIGASSGVIGAFLPLLTGSLAHGRHIKRIEDAINDIEESISKQELKIDELTDAQYKIIGDAINCMLSTVDEEKIEYLKKAIRNSFKPESASEIESETEVLSRILRDISAKEAQFIVNRIYNEIPFTEITLPLHKKPTDPKSKYKQLTGNKGILTVNISGADPSESTVSKDSLGIVKEDKKMLDFINRLLFLGLLRKSGVTEHNERYNFTVFADKIKNLLSE